MEGGLVSVIITTYYRNEILEECLRSVRAQTYDPIEIIVVDGSGEGHASSVVEETDHVSYVAMDENKGPHAARSVGIEHSSGEYVQLLDDDDILAEEKIQKQVATLRNSEDIGVVYCGQKNRSGDIALPAEQFSGDVLEDALAMNTYCCQTSTMLIRHDVLEDIVPFENWWTYDDITLMIELAQRTEFDYVREPLVLRGEDVENLSTRIRNVSRADSAREIIEYYDQLYDQHPRSRDAFLARAYKEEAHLLIGERFYSIDAVASYWRSMRLSESITLRDVLELLAIGAGKPVWVIGYMIYGFINRRR